MPFRRIAILAALVPFAAGAQTAPAPDRLGWLDLLTPDAIVARVVQSGLLALRSKAELTYDALAIDLRAGRISLVGLRVVPDLPYAADGPCEVAAERIVIRTAEWSDVERLRLKLGLGGVSAPLGCLPPTARMVRLSAGLDTLRLPKLTVDVDYDLPSAGAGMRVFAQVDGVAAASVDLDFSYLWVRSVEGPTGDDRPEVDGRLRAATVTVDDLGGWRTARQFLPPPLTDPDLAGDTVAAMLGQLLDTIGMEGPARAELLSSASAAWPAFVADPSRLVLETGFDGEVEILPDMIAQRPGPFVSSLEPRFDTVARQLREAIPVDVLQRVTTGDPASFDPAEARRVGTALVTGRGAPQDREAGLALLRPLAERGDAEAAHLVAETLMSADPAAAYRSALAAAAAGIPGSAPLLDEIEAALPMAGVLATQNAVAGDLPGLQAIGDLGAIRSAAAAARDGTGRVRSYAHAVFWASLGAAAGDAAAADILDDLERIGRGTDDPAWDTMRTEAGARARQVWIDADLPARLAGD